LRERRLRLAPQGRRPEEPARPRARDAAPRRARGHGAAQAAPALGRPAAARCARPRARVQPARAPPRRAARRSRPEAPQADAALPETDPARHRHHLHPRHARPGGGDDDGRRHRRHEQGPDRAAGLARRALRAAGDAVRRRRDPVRRRDSKRQADRLRPERPAGSRGGGTGRPAHPELESGRDLRRRFHGGIRMTDLDLTVTRRQLLRRAAAGGTILTLPGLLAACGGSTKKSATTGTSGGGKKQLAKTLYFSNWPLYIDINEKTKTHPSLTQFTKQTGVKVNYVEDINDNDQYFGKIEGPLSQNQSIHKDIIVMTDSSGLPARMIELKWLEKLDKSALPNSKNLIP